MKKLKEMYTSPTPAKWRKIGDSIFALGTLFSGGQVMAGNSTLALIGILLTWVGKTVTNLASE
jgi:hypothetical protein